MNALVTARRRSALYVDNVKAAKSEQDQDRLASAWTHGVRMSLELSAVYLGICSGGNLQGVYAFAFTAGLRSAHFEMSTTGRTYTSTQRGMTSQKAFT